MQWSFLLLRGLMTLALLDDPAYEPLHPPVDGKIPDVVRKWGSASQRRWFARYAPELGVLPYETWDAYHVLSGDHRGLCCWQCETEEHWDGEGCCCKKLRS